ncbi:MAG: TIGR02147 family protein [Polyangiales bacterium]
MPGAPDVFDFDDYRAFLRAHYAHKKASGRGFSLRVFSRLAGLTSSNYLKLVMDGDRNLGAEAAERFASACGLEASRASYFVELVALQQAKTQPERERAYEHLRSHRRFRQAHPLDDEYAAYHAHWYVPAVRELAARKDFEADPKWIAARLMPAITSRQATRALKVLRELGLLVEDKGKLRQAHALVKTPDKPLSHHVVRFHRVMMERAAEALDLVPREQREIASLTLCLSDRQLRALKAELAQLRGELLRKYGAEADAKRVVQLNLHMFPLSIEE